MNSFLRTSYFVLAFALAAANANAASAAFASQGALREVDGSVPAEKNRAVEFRIYDQASGGNALWGRTCNVLLDANGLFNATVGDTSGSAIDGLPGTGLASILAANAGSTLYVGITVNSTSGEISPRQSLLAVPYAFYAADASSASGDFAVAGRATASTLSVSGAAAFGAVEASRLTVSGDVTLSTAGKFTGYGTIPVGGIIMWSGSASAVPDGWALCNGQTSNGRQTPDLRGRFVVGYDPSRSDYGVGMIGGAESVTLTKAQMPKHTHTSSVKTVGYAAAYNGSKEAATYDDSSKNNGEKNIESDEAGSNQAHENRPPYYAICFIMRVK